MKILLLTLVLSFNTAMANTDAVANDDSKIQAKAIMGGVYESFVKVIPYVYSGENSVEILKKDPAKKAELIKNLTDISDFFKSAKHVEYFQRPGFRPSLDTMNGHLTDTINSVQNNNFAFAQKRLSAVTSLCISCHSQLSGQGTANAFGDAINKAKRSDFESDYAFGNYLYLIRRFDDSEKFLNLALERSLKESRSHELYSSLRRVISIHTKISFNYDKANSFVNKYKKDLRLPVLAKTTLESWSKSLVPWKKFDSGKVNSIEEFIKTHLNPLEELKEQTGGDNDITLLIASGVLSKYLNDHPQTPNAPLILYWLAVAERRLSTTYFFTLSDLYLKDCVRLYPKTAFAKKCYALYEENIQFGYSGSGGTDIPPDEKRELARMRALLK
jgi:hypothetical protein